MASDLETLIDFGFPEYKAKKALKATNNSGLQPALDWLEAHGEDEENFKEPEKTQKTCLKCNTCNKRFMKLEQAELHAGRTLHEDFEEAAYEETDLEAQEQEEEEESTNTKVSLSEEEKVARLAELRKKLALKREAREKETKEAEVLRKTSSRELEQIRRDMQAKEMKLLAEERRLEKIADRKRREDIKRQIEEDRANKKAQIEAEKAKAASGTIVNDDVVKVVEEAPLMSSGSGSSIARIQVKLPAPNPPLKMIFNDPAKETLKDLKDRIKKEFPNSSELMQTFPTRVFGKDDDYKSLNELGLSPSASLILK